MLKSALLATAMTLYKWNYRNILWKIYLALTHQMKIFLISHQSDNHHSLISTGTLLNDSVRIWDLIHTVTLFTRRQIDSSCFSCHS